MNKKPDPKLVKEYFDTYHVEVKKNPNLYCYPDGTLNVSLSKELCWEFSEASSGDSGGKDARPVGIRRTKNQRIKSGMSRSAKQARNTIFSSTKNLSQFLMTSKCDGAKHLESKKRKHSLVNNSTVINTRIQITIDGKKYMSTLDNLTRFKDNCIIV